MNEQDLKNLLNVYQQKLSDFLSQTIALEVRLLSQNQIIDNLSKKVEELGEENEKLKAAKAKKPQAKENLDQF